MPPKFALPTSLAAVAPRTELITTGLGVASTLLTLYIASHQFLVLLRWLPLVHLSISAIFQTLLALKTLRYRFGFGASPQSATNSGHPLGGWVATCALAALLGVQHTLFIWSFLKLPPACAIAIHALVEPLSSVAVLYVPAANKNNDASNPSSRAAAMKTWARIAVLLLVVDRVVPMNPSGLIQAVLSLLLNVLSSVAQSTRTNRNAGASTGNLNHGASFITSILALFPAWLMTITFAPAQFGLKYYPVSTYVSNRISFFAGVSYALYQWRLQAITTNTSASSSPFLEAWKWDSLTGASALIISAFVATMRERIALWDVIALAAFAYLTWSEVKTHVVDPLDGDDYEVFGAEDYELPGTSLTTFC